ncbi:MAG TPA: hypothetical protein PLX14_05525 [Anaerolineales bacterium]|nr:hypothetical protein [Anaerolineales bacterium]
MSIINDIFQPIYGKPCWQVEQGYGSFLTFEFGQPFLKIHGPRQASEQATEKVRKNAARRQVYVYGDWHLWVYLCDWRILSYGKEMANHSSNRRTIKKATAELNGQSLTQVNIDEALVSVFDFDLGGRLEIFPNYEDYKTTSDLWLLYEKPGNVFVLRADGQYSYHPGNIPRNEINWTRFISQNL